MFVKKIKIKPVNEEELVAEKGKIFFDGKIKAIKVSHEDGFVRIEFDNESEWDGVVYPFSNLESFTYVKQKRDPPVLAVG